MKARLVMTSNGREHSFPLDRPRTLIGRAMRCDVRVPLLTVGHEHCEIAMTEDGLEIVDLGSEGGTTLNGDTVEEPTPVGPNDTVGIGPVTFRVSIEPADDGAATSVAEPKPHGLQEPPMISTRPPETASPRTELR